MNGNGTGRFDDNHAIFETIAKKLIETLDVQATVSSTNNLISAKTLRNEVLQMKSEIENSQNIVNAFTNIDFGGFSVNDGELIVDYFDNAYSVPSLVDGEFIITY